MSNIAMNKLSKSETYLIETALAAKGRQSSTQLSLKGLYHIHGRKTRNGGGIAGAANNKGLLTNSPRTKQNNAQWQECKGNLSRN